MDIEGAGATGNSVQGNYIGTNAAGPGAVQNNDGVRIFECREQHDRRDRRRCGQRHLRPRPTSLSGSGSRGELATWCRATTSAPTPPARRAGQTFTASCCHDGASNNTIGGTAAGARNVISGSSSGGVGVGLIARRAATLVQGNYIGTDAAGTRPYQTHLVSSCPTATNNTIGGTVAGAGNLIPGNGSGCLISSCKHRQPDQRELDHEQRRALGIDLGMTGSRPTTG